MTDRIERCSDAVGESIVVRAIHDVRVRVVWLHGYTMRPDEMIPSARVLSTHAEFWLPGGPIPVEGGGRSWWSIDVEARARALALGARDLAAFDPPGRDEARTRVASLIEHVRALHPHRPIVLAGFSQGAMLACDVTLHAPDTVAALALFSGSRIAIHRWTALGARLARLRVLVSHGRSDDALAFGAGERLRDFLVEADAHVDWLPFEGGHIIPAGAWRRFRALLAEVGAPFAPKM